MIIKIIKILKLYSNLNKKTYDLKNAKKIWTKVTTSKISRNEAEKLHKELTQKDADALEREKSNSIKKHNILKILHNIDAIFTGAYFHHREVPKKTIVERSIAKRVQLTRGRIAEIEEEKSINDKLFKEYFTNYQSPSDMYKKLCETEAERNEDRVYLIKEVLNRLKIVIENVSKNKTLMVEENNKIINIVERIIYFNQQDQSGQGLKILTPNQTLSRLPITLAQLKAENNSEKLKNEIRQLLYSL